MATRDDAKKQRRGRRWRLTDAKARFSEVVKLAREHPQHVTVDGRDAVVIVSAEVFARERSRKTGAELVEAFGRPDLAQLELTRTRVEGPHRDVEL